MVERHDLESLVTKAQEGDRPAFDAAVATCRDKLESFVRSRVGGHLRQEVEVEDVLQETYVQALTSISRFHWTGSESLLRWLNGIAQHVILSSARGQQKQKGRVLYVEQELSNHDPTPSKAMRREERSDRLRDALNTLNPDHREAICLVRIEGLRVKEAAKRMNRTPKAVMHLLARGLKELRDSFGDTESLNLSPEGLRNRDDA